MQNGRKVAKPPGTGEGTAVLLTAQHQRFRSITTEPEVELSQIASLAAELYSRLSANLPIDCLPEDVEDVRLAKDIAQRLLNLTMFA